MRVNVGIHPRINNYSVLNSFNIFSGLRDIIFLSFPNKALMLSQIIAFDAPWSALNGAISPFKKDTSPPPFSIASIDKVVQLLFRRLYSSITLALLLFLFCFQMGFYHFD